MNAYELITPGGEPSGVWVCENCRHYHCDRTYCGQAGSGQRMANRCCTPSVCEECKQPVLEVQSRYDGTVIYRPMHDACWRSRRARKLAERLEKAEKLEGHDGWLYWDGRGPNEGYFRDMDELLDYLADCDEDGDGEEPPGRPEWVFACREVPFRGVDPGRVYEDLTEEMFEDAAEHLCGTAEFEAACRAFNEANKHLISYEPDYSRAVRVPKEE